MNRNCNNDGERIWTDKLVHGNQTYGKNNA